MKKTTIKKNGEISICRCVPHAAHKHADEKEKHSVHSKAVVKFQTVKSPSSFARLECNTNLNTPPSNWLTNSANYGLQKTLSNSTGFSSFSMADMFPDCLGEVDVVSNAENIKRLLKLPYSPKNIISMMIHRVENTLLIDEFDIHKYLLRQAGDDWKWLRSFIYENIINSLSDKDRAFLIKNKSHEALQKRNLISKFLYHSLPDDTKTNTNKKTQSSSVSAASLSASTSSSSAPTNVPIFSRKTSTSITVDPLKKVKTITTKSDSSIDDKKLKVLLALDRPLLPEPNIDENMPDPHTSCHIYNRNVVWTFEDIRMLIGTDMPIFGGETRPCISLRLRDMTLPINVLTGIDYWLDNLMCNVPEVVMCYHLDGLVQKYEIIKTEDLPHLENSKFSAKTIRNVAQNLLAFLKQNATKAGHTYWLFKGRNDDVVKLYDLTTLCNNIDETDDIPDEKKNKKTPPTAPKSNGKNGDSVINSNGANGININNDIKSETLNGNGNKIENPFTVPVAMLLYKVARNMKNTLENITSKQAGSIKTLLDNCIKLLPKEKYPQIVTSSHYILSDLYIPTGIDPNSPNFNEQSAKSSDVQSFIDDDQEFDMLVNDTVDDDDDDDDNDDDDDVEDEEGEEEEEEEDDDDEEDEGDDDEEDEEEENEEGGNVYNQGDDNNNENDDNANNVNAFHVNNNNNNNNNNVDKESDQYNNTDINHLNSNIIVNKLGKPRKTDSCNNNNNDNDDINVNINIEINIHTDNNNSKNKNIKSIIDIDKVNKNISVKNISDTLNEFHLEENWKHNQSPPPLIGNVHERCFIALHHILDGLRCLKYFSPNTEKLVNDDSNNVDGEENNDELDEITKEEQKLKILHEERNPNMAKPYQAIPLPYEKLKTESIQLKEIDLKNELALNDAYTSISTATTPNSKNKNNKRNRKKSITLNKKKGRKDDDDEDDDECSNNDLSNNNNSPRSLLLSGKSGIIESWNVHLKLLLLEKACLIYATLIEQTYSDENYGRSLKYIFIAMRCQLIVTKHMSSMSSQQICLLGRAGDCYFQMAKHFDKINGYISDFHVMTEIDRLIIDEIIHDIEDNFDDDYDLPQPLTNFEQLMMISCACYESALNYANKVSKRELLRRLGSARNELGVKYMHWAQDEYVKYQSVNKKGHAAKESAKTAPKTEPLFQTLTKKSYDSLARGVSSFEEINDKINLAILLCNLGRFMRFRAHVNFVNESFDNIPLKRKFYETAFFHYNRAIDIIEKRDVNPDLYDAIKWELSTGTYSLVQYIQDSTKRKDMNEAYNQKLIELLKNALRCCDLETPNSRLSFYQFRVGSIYNRLAIIYKRKYKKENDDLRKKNFLKFCRSYYEKSSNIFESLNEGKEYIDVQINRIGLQEMLCESTLNPPNKIKQLQMSLDIFKQSKAIFKCIEKLMMTQQFEETLIKFEQLLQLTLKKLIKLCMLAKIATEKIPVYKNIYSMTLRSPERLDTLKLCKHLLSVLEKFEI